MSVGTAPRRKQTLPVSEEASQCVLFNRFDFATQPGERFAPNLAQDFRVAPLAMQPAGTEAAFEYPAFYCELAKRVFNDRVIEGEAVSYLPQRKRAMGARVAANEFKHRLRNRLDQRNGQAGRKRNPESIAVAGRVLHSNKAALSSDAQLKQSSRAQKTVKQFEHCSVDNAPGKFFARQIAQAKKQVVDAIG